MGLEHIPRFDRFWSCYPQRTGKGQAQKTFDKIFKGMSDEDQESLLRTIVLAIDAQIRHRKRMKDHSMFVPDWKSPSHWLNAKCWLDEFQEIEEKSEKRYFYKPPCAECQNISVININGTEYCAWHYTKKFLDDSSLGLNVLRERWKLLIRDAPRLDGESYMAYCQRLIKMHNIKMPEFPK